MCVEISVFASAYEIALHCFNALHVFAMKVLDYSDYGAMGRKLSSTQYYQY